MTSNKDKMYLVDELIAISSGKSVRTVFSAVFFSLIKIILRENWVNYKKNPKELTIIQLFYSNCCLHEIQYVLTSQGRYADISVWQ